MPQQYHNPFAGIDLVAPVEQRDAYLRYCQSGGHAVVDQSPFPRMVDFWFMGLCMAGRKRIKPIDISKGNTFKFIEGSIFDRDSWRVQTIMIVAIAIEDDVDIIGDPRHVMTIANGLAAAGVPHVEAMLGEGKLDPIWNVSEALHRVLSEKDG